MINWQTKPKPTALGGVGVGSLKYRNTSLLLKWLWRFSFENEAFWRRVILAIYGCNSSGWKTEDIRLLLVEDHGLISLRIGPLIWLW